MDLCAEAGLPAADNCADVPDEVSGALLLMIPFIGVLGDEVDTAVAVVLALDVAVLPASVAILGTPVPPPPAGLDDTTRGCLLADGPPSRPHVGKSIPRLSAQRWTLQHTHQGCAPNRDGSKIQIQAWKRLPNRVRLSL